MRRLAPGFLVLPASRAGILHADALSDVLKADLARERRRLAADSSQLAELSRRLETAVSELSSASRAVADMAARADSSPDELARREDVVARAEQDVRMLLDRRRVLVARIPE